MTLPQVGELFDYWSSHPPVHELVAMYLGYERPKTAEEQWAAGALNPAEFAARFDVICGDSFFIAALFYGVGAPLADGE